MDMIATASSFYDKVFLSFDSYPFVIFKLPHVFVGNFAGNK